ncbi:MAG: hypothetical protein QOC80_2616, partial [Frankiaceae bacterium]|nr:hypothetical protein [Frankiaceae bacterium]
MAFFAGDDFPAVVRAAVALAAVLRAGALAGFAFVALVADDVPDDLAGDAVAGLAFAAFVALAGRRGVSGVSPGSAAPPFAASA